MIGMCDYAEYADRILMLEEYLNNTIKTLKDGTVISKKQAKKYIKSLDESIAKIDFIKQWVLEHEKQEPLYARTNMTEFPETCGDCDLPVLIMKEGNYRYVCPTTHRMILEDMEDSKPYDCPLQKKEE